MAGIMIHYTPGEGGIELDFLFSNKIPHKDKEGHYLKGQRLTIHTGPVDSYCF